MPLIIWLYTEVVKFQIVNILQWPIATIRFKERELFINIVPRQFSIERFGG